MAQSKEESAWERLSRPWWAKMAFGAVSIVLAVLIWNDFTKLESGERQSLFVTHTTGFLYDIGGKPLAAGLPVVAGVGFIAWGAVQLARGKQE